MFHTTSSKAVNSILILQFRRGCTKQLG
uniref:Uncharacterized protein n=1 Tax=Anguilla anguilla TaxID=7936 RepID=A0A0E9VXL8_ANGAN